jgi:hypothetical protein
MTINPAYRELIDLAAVMRGPDWARALEGAAANPQVRAAWDWPQFYGHASRLLGREDAHPRELIEACNDPTVRKADPLGFEAAAKIRADAHARVAEAKIAGPRVTPSTPQPAKREPAA